MRLTPEDYRSIALRAAAQLDRTVSYLRSGRADKALDVALNAANDLRYELAHRQKPPASKRERSAQPATPLPS